MPSDPRSILKRFAHAKTLRQNWQFHWQEVANLCLPTRDFTIQTRHGGEQRRARIFNSTAPEAVESLASSLDGMLTNTAIRWFSLSTDSDSMNEEEEVQDWLYDTTGRMLSYFDSPESGFATAAHEIYLDLCAFGTAIMLVTNRDGNLKFQAKQLSNIFVLANDSGDLTDVFRKFELPAREVVQQFGDAASDTVKSMASDPNKEMKEVSILHHVYKRFDREYDRDDVTNKPWASVYIEVDKKVVLRESGFDENPYIVARWSRAPEEIYGRSPAMKVLPTIKVVNAMARTILEAGELAVRPPIMVSAGSMEGPIRTAPGSIMYMRQGTRDVPQPLMSGARPDIGAELMEREEQKIEQAFFLDRLRLPDNDRMTATEVVERRQQGLLIASPILARLYAEWLNPIIKRTYAWMVRTGRVSPPPSYMDGENITIHYVSPMSQSRRASQSQGFLQAMSSATALIQTDPTVMMNLNADSMFRALFRMNNVDPNHLRSEREVAQQRAELQQQQQMSEQMEQAQMGASAAKDAASAAKEFGGVE